MRSLLPFLAAAVLLAVTVTPAQAFWGRNANLPTPDRMDANPYNPATFSYNPAYWWHLHNHYPKATFSAMPEGPPPGPPTPPFCTYPVIVRTAYIPPAPDLMNPGPYGVVPPFPPFQGMLLPPCRPNGGPGGPQMGGGGAAMSGVFGVHPFARSPRDFFMAGD
jgi:hypothetical protein